MSSEEFAPPKYAQIVQAIRQKIADGTYPPGSMLPSETQLVREFGVSRPTVVRALQVLQLRGTIVREHGKGSFVKTAPPVSEEENTRPGRAVLDRAEADESGSRVLSVGVRQHLQAVRGLKLQHVAERLSARHPSADEAKLLNLRKTAPVLGVLASIFNGGGRPVLIVDLVLPGDLHELEDAYGL